MEKCKISKESIECIQTQIKDLDNLLTERISDFNQVKGMVQARHAYIYYRKLLWEISETLKLSLENMPDPKQK